MSYIIPPPVKVEFPEQIVLSNAIGGNRADVAASERAVSALAQHIRDHFWDYAPSGTVRIHTGTLTNIPRGWVLCDGNNGTPPMVDRAIVGAGGDYEPNATFGSKTQTPSIATQVTVQGHTLSLAQMPRHAHDTFLPRGDRSYSDGQGNALWGSRLKYGIRSSPQGSSQPHHHGASAVSTASAIHTLQPSVAVIWIMKI